MRRLARHLFTILSALSLLLCVAVCVLWVRSYARVHVFGLDKETWPQHQLWRRYSVNARIAQGCWLLSYERRDFDLGHPEGIGRGRGTSDAETFRHAHAGGFHPLHVAFDMPPPPLDPLMMIPCWHGFGQKYQIRKTLSRTDLTNRVVFPAWLSVLALLVLPLTRAAHVYRRHRRSVAGHCPT